jgi:hypothetical protein
VPIVPATWEAEVGKSFEPTRSRSTWTTYRDKKEGRRRKKGRKERRKEGLISCDQWLKDPISTFPASCHLARLWPRPKPTTILIAFRLILMPYSQLKFPTQMLFPLLHTPSSKLHFGGRGGGGEATCVPLARPSSFLPNATDIVVQRLAGWPVSPLGFMPESW